MKRFKWTIEIEVDETWVADGFEITNENIEDYIQDWLPYATEDEFDGKVIKSPSKKSIIKAQGGT